MKKLFPFIILTALSLLLLAQNPKGGISPELLSQLKGSFEPSPSDRAIFNAISNVDINMVAVNTANEANFDTYFSDRVQSKGISDQHSSGRCWIFTGVNVLRAKMIAKYNLNEFHFSHNYLFFYDQLEKSNLFLELIIETRKLPMDDKTVNWLFQNPIGDGGQFTGVSDLISKYGCVPSSVMPENNSSNNTRTISHLLSLKLREFGLRLREQPKASEEQLRQTKGEMLKTIYRMLSLAFGEPPTEFSYTLRDANNKEISTKQYTPSSFFQEHLNEDLTGNYVMLMNDPSREYYKLYEIQFDRHVYDGFNWRYINLPVEDIKQMAIASIKDSVMMYFSCDVGKFYNRKKGLLDLKNYDYESLMGTTFPMNKKERILTYASGSSHAMTLCAVDLKNGNPEKWLVENSWGASNGYRGHLIITDEWFNEYMFRLVVERKYVPAKIREITKQKPIMLTPWDPMVAPEIN